MEPSLKDMVEDTTQAVNMFKFNQALVYAASRTNYLGGQGLLFPLKSSVFRGIVQAGSKAIEATPLFQLDAAMLQAVIQEAVAAYHGDCE